MATVKIIGKEFLDRILEIEQSAQQDPWSVGLLTSCFSSNYIVLGYLDDQKILQGYLIFNYILDESELQNIAVDPKKQNHGIGSTLINEYFSQWHNLGISKSFLEVRVSNSRALHVYEKFGYTKCGLRKGYYPCDKGREDAVIMQCVVDGMLSN